MDKETKSLLIKKRILFLGNRKEKIASLVLGEEKEIYNDFVFDSSGWSGCSNTPVQMTKNSENY